MKEEVDALPSLPGLSRTRSTSGFHHLPHHLRPPLTQRALSSTESEQPPVLLGLWSGLTTAQASGSLVLAGSPGDP